MRDQEGGLQAPVGQLPELVEELAAVGLGDARALQPALAVLVRELDGVLDLALAVHICFAT